MNFFKALGEAFVETCQEMKDEAKQENKKNVQHSNDFSEFENEFNTGIADPTPSYFDIGNLEHQFYHPHHPVYSK